MNPQMTLGKSNLYVPRMGIGAMVWGQPKGMARWTPAQLAYGPSHGTAEEAEALKVSLDAGVNLIDTAEMYSGGFAERRVGELTRDKNVLIATKFPPSPFSREDAFSKSLQDSLTRLERNSLDLYQHHFPSNRISIPKLMNLMAEAVEAGKIKTVGVSNYSAEQMRLAHAELAKRGIPLASNQVQYSLVYRKPEVDGMLDACRELGITLIAYSPLGMGALTGKYSTQTKASGLRRFLPGFNRKSLEAIQPVVELLRQIGNRYGKTPSQVALRWLIENENVLPIPGVKNSRQAADNVGALSFSLTPEEVQMLSQATMAWRI